MGEKTQWLTWLLWGCGWGEKKGSLYNLLQFSSF
jgi:hypothetical protein